MRFACRVMEKSPKPPSYYVIRTFPILTKQEKEARFMVTFTRPKESRVSLYHFILCYLFVFIISSLVILYRDDFMFGDLNIVRFILLVLMFVVSIMFLIISPNIISILLG